MWGGTFHLFSDNVPHESFHLLNILDCIYTACISIQGISNNSLFVLM